MKDLRALFSLSQDVLSVPEFVDALFVELEGFRSMEQNPISRNGQISKTLEAFTRLTQGCHDGRTWAKFPDTDGRTDGPVGPG